MTDELVLYDDDELSELLNEQIVDRSVVGEWPLSWAQRVTTDTGRRYAYKAMLPPLIEAEFYASTSNPLLPHHIQTPGFGRCSTLLIEWIDLPSLADRHLTDDQAITHAYAVRRQLDTLPTTLPVYLDVGTASKWSDEVGRTLDKLRHLIADNRFASISVSMVDRLQHWLVSHEVLSHVDQTSCLVHRDLKPEHVFPVEGGGYYVIDWQVPVIAPRNVDIVGLLLESGIDPLPHTTPVDFGIAAFLRLRWATVAQHDFFPDSRFPVLDGWAASAILAIQRVAL